MQQPVVVIEPEEQRPDAATFRGVSKSADDAIDRPYVLDLFHAGPEAGLIRQIVSLGDDAIQPNLFAVQPLLRDVELRRDRRKLDGGRLGKRARQERFELS